MIPENDFGKFLSRGFKAFVIILVYSIPSMIFQDSELHISNVAAQNASNDDGSGALVGGMAVIAICSGALGCHLWFVTGLCNAGSLTLSS